MLNKTAPILFAWKKRIFQVLEGGPAYAGGSLEFLKNTPYPYKIIMRMYFRTPEYSFPFFSLERIFVRIFFTQNSNKISGENGFFLILIHIETMRFYKNRVNAYSHKGLSVFLYVKEKMA